MHTDVFGLLARNSSESVNPTDFVEKCWLSFEFEPKAQQDVYEFFEKLINVLGISLGEPFSNIFEGIRVSSISHASLVEDRLTQESFTTVSLQVTEESVVGGFRRFVQVFDVDEFKLPDVGRVTVQKRYTFFVLPPVLVIQLLRFVFVDDRNSIKRSDKCSFDDDVDLSFLLAPDRRSDQGHVYNLVGLVVHFGGPSIKQGHYKSFTRKDSQWYCCNDATVGPVTPFEAMDNNYGAGYLLFYTHAPKLPGANGGP